MIAPEFDLPLNIEETSRSYVTINYLDAKYCLTCNKETYPQDITYVLLTDTRPTKEKLASCSVCTSNPQLSSSASFLRLNVLSSLN